MFTGIVQGIANIIDVKDDVNLRQLTLLLPESLAHSLNIGASIAINGCCLTIVAFHQQKVQFDVMAETLAKTTLGSFKINDEVNIERAVKIGEEIGGHLTSGHISCTAKISKVAQQDSRYSIVFSVDANWMRYILYKGFITVDGISLTVGEITENSFAVHLIPETLTKTTLSQKQPGDFVNIEIDPQTQAIVDTVERVLTAR